VARCICCQSCVKQHQAQAVEGRTDRRLAARVAMTYCTYLSLLVTSPGNPRTKTPCVMTFWHVKRAEQ